MDDQDWYSVNLPTGTQTLSINSTKPLTAIVYDSNDTVVFTTTYGPTTKIGQKFNVTQAGTYYIKITSVNIKLF